MFKLLSSFRILYTEFRIKAQKEEKSMQKSKNYWIEQLNLLPHPEGGYYKTVPQPAEQITTEDQRERPLYTSIYFLLSQESPSHFHRLKSDEIWYFHAGETLTIHLLYPDGHYEQVKLGTSIENKEVLQYTVPKGVIFGSSIEENGDYALVSCMVAPGFDYQDFELFTQAQLLEVYPHQREVIRKLAFESLPD